MNNKLIIGLLLLGLLAFAGCPKSDNPTGTTAGGATAGGGGTAGGSAAGGAGDAGKASDAGGE